MFFGSRLGHSLGNPSYFVQLILEAIGDTCRSAHYLIGILFGWFYVFYESFGFGGGMSVGGSFNFVVCVFQLLKTFYRVLIF